MIGKIKDESRQDGDEEAGNNEVDCVEEGLSPQTEVISDVHILLWPATSAIDHFVSCARKSEQIPFCTSENYPQAVLFGLPHLFSPEHFVQFLTDSLGVKRCKKTLYHSYYAQFCEMLQHGFRQVSALLQTLNNICNLKGT